ncbi:conjugal transfer protein TraW [Sphingobium yanoikuyae]|uniref:Conjugal transfer protein TraW n=1 Tax=Sphingobium yanoikuyae TaxID=13690 RepID=A0A291N770_SPHYA|nr:conjugal transfer protein TraW [Sphingobium yanoikuyae]
MPATRSTAATSTIGRTWPIAEADAMTEIESRAATAGNLASRMPPRGNWSALQPASLPRAQESRIRKVVPFHLLEDDIRLPDGRVLYPKGFRFNPLEYVTLPQRLVIVHPRDLDWAVRTAAPTDFILLTAGDAVTLSEKSGRPIYILEERVKVRLGLTVAPVIVAQVGKALELREIRLSPRSGKGDLR